MPHPSLTLTHWCDDTSLGGCWPCSRWRGRPGWSRQCTLTWYTAYTCHLHFEHETRLFPFSLLTASSATPPSRCPSPPRASCPGTSSSSPCSPSSCPSPCVLGPPPDCTQPPRTSTAGGTARRTRGGARTGGRQGQTLYKHISAGAAGSVVAIIKKSECGTFFDSVWNQKNERNRTVKHFPPHDSLEKLLLCHLAKMVYCF